MIEGILIRIPAPEFVSRIVEVPSAKEEAEMKNLLGNLIELVSGIVDSVLKSEDKNKKPEKTKKTKATAPKTEETIHHSTAELAVALDTTNNNVSTLIKKFNETGLGKITCPGAGTKNVGYSAAKSDWSALTNWRHLHKRK